MGLLTEGIVHYLSINWNGIRKYYLSYQLSRLYLPRTTWCVGFVCLRTEFTMSFTSELQLYYKRYHQLTQIIPIIFIVAIVLVYKRNDIDEYEIYSTEP